MLLRHKGRINILIPCNLRKSLLYLPLSYLSMRVALLMQLAVVTPECQILSWRFTRKPRYSKLRYRHLADSYRHLVTAKEIIVLVQITPRSSSISILRASIRYLQDTFLLSRMFKAIHPYCSPQAAHQLKLNLLNKMRNSDKPGVRWSPRSVNSSLHLSTQSIRHRKPKGKLFHPLHFYRKKAFQ